jgi:hypothetical protein
VSGIVLLVEVGAVGFGVGLRQLVELLVGAYSKAAVRRNTDFQDFQKVFFRPPA